jgi:hypothetical protein
MYEHRSAPMLTRHGFAHRMLKHFLLSQLLVGGSLVVGIVGYHYLANFAWIDSFLNATMLLGGMGPIGDIPTPAGKIFAGIYALYAGLVLITVSGLLLAPILHRILHTFHLEGKS